MAEIRDDSALDSPAFEVRFIGESKGKGLFAVKPFKAGDVIFEERPLVCCQFAWNAAYGYLACDFCMRPLEGAEENVRRLTGKKDIVLPYPHCCPTNRNSHTQCPSCGVWYCSSTCQEQAWNQYHRTLCLQSHSHHPNHPLEQLNGAWKHMHYPPETTSVMLLARMIATVQQAEDPANALHFFMQFCHRTVNEEQEIAHKLLGEQFKGQMQVLQELMVKALYSDSVQQWLSPDGFQSLMALVGTNGQGVGTSPFSEWVKKVSELELAADEKQQLDSFIDKLYEDLNEEVGTFLNNEGSALYALQSVCNHSCDPNATPTFPHSNFQLAMCAVRDIAPGDEILISYLDECALERSRHSRQKLLRQNYLFICHCPKCETQAEDADVTSEDECEEEEGEE
ncbi:SET and MYND domain-containing protein 5 [Cryptotermes secundus]|nr:SET and MYND domain-containing protein 5 [Cryptotermes secundus]XP_023722900.2 SET and MYND domain-containing protein 5 [Cryptotermes secundus]XP_033610758.1 SET and MYND domain-containing protein 5 [Cryptotermes secundus]